MTDPNRSVADELEEVEFEIRFRSTLRPRSKWNAQAIEFLRERAAALRYDFALLAYAGRKP